MVNIQIEAKKETKRVTSKVKASKYEELCSRLGTKEGINEVIDWQKLEKGKPVILLIKDV